jgi:hypothetical protein
MHRKEAAEFQCFEVAQSRIKFIRVRKVKADEGNKQGDVEVGLYRRRRRRSNASLVLSGCVGHQSNLYGVFAHEPRKGWDLSRVCEIVKAYVIE